MLESARRIGRRGLLLSGAAAGIGALGGRVARAQVQQPSQGPDGIEWLDYEPPRRWAAGARVGNVVYLAGETGEGSDIATQTRGAMENIRARGSFEAWRCGRGRIRDVY